MTHDNDQLQADLARLEAGEALEHVLAGQPADQAELLRLAADLRSAPLPALSPDAAAAQRRALQAAARASLEASPMTPISPPPTRRPLWAALAAATGLLAVFAFCATAAASAGAFWWWTTTRAPVAQPAAGTPSSAQATAVAANPVTAVRQAAVVQPPDAATAALQAVRGLVEVETAEGWTPVADGALVRAGAHLRTGPLSSATLAFYDGSAARLGPNSVIRLEALDAQRSGPRVIRLNQTAGESDHTVAKSADPGSAYEVATPTGAGQAKGTVFHVSVTAVLVQFAVSEGAVAVTHLQITVIVVAGQTTLISGDQPPSEPAFQITGEGQVQQVGAEWIIGGQTLAVTPETVVTGDPQVGDWAAFTGRRLADGRQVADTITLMHRSLANTFSFIGTVEAIGAPDAGGVSVWTISGRAIRTDAASVIEAGLSISDVVEVTGGIAADGAFWASAIRRFAAEPAGAPFSFTGVVEATGPEAWVISGISVTVNVSTTIAAGLTISDVVQVQGVILTDGTWLARSIQPAELETFDFVGVVLSTEPWNVAGVPLATDAATEIDEDIQIGNRVRARGQILGDGTWLAASIEQIDEGRRHAVQFTAHVESIDPWVIGGVSVTVDSKTKIIGNPQVGDLARVQGNLLPDGNVIANKITRLAGGVGCTSVSAVVSALTGTALTLSDGRTIALTDAVQPSGQLRIASVILITTCVNADGQATVISIVVIYQLDTLPPTPTPAPAVGCLVAVQVANGRLVISSGTQVALGNGAWLEIELKKKGDEAKIKVNGEKPEIEIKVKKQGEIEVKVEGSGHLAVTGAGNYPAGTALIVQVCANADGTIVITVTTGAVTVAPAPAPSGPVTICHIPPGNPDKRKTQTVDQGDVQGHLGHGDTLGPCGGGGDDDDDDDDKGKKDD
ncbi:MAG: FecR domain-containing protein [Anaerolineales bacterium]|nr:FecR domain-containing protein [Anaerolineales bacterium]